MIQQSIQAYYGNPSCKEGRRYRSWEHCYEYFHKRTSAEIIADKDNAALQLGFYLASWGMFRGSSFLLQHDYTIHFGVIEQLIKPCFSALWKVDFGSYKDDINFVDDIWKAVNKIKEIYLPFAQATESRGVTNTLATKVILGTFGSLPAYDKYFKDGLKSAKLYLPSLNMPPNFNKPSIKCLFNFCQFYLDDLKNEQKRIATDRGVHYPLMKLVDMCFWQIGYDHAEAIRG